MHKLQCKHIYRINSSMHIKEFMWLCAKRRDNLTNHQTDLVHSIYKLFWSFWKSVIKVFLYNCLTWLCPQTAGIQLRTQWPHLLCYICSLYPSNLYHVWKILYSVACPIFLVILVPQITRKWRFCSLTRWMETMLYLHMFYAIFQFCAQVKFESLDGNIATAAHAITVYSITHQTRQSVGAFTD